MEDSGHEACEDIPESSYPLIIAEGIKDGKLKVKGCNVAKMLKDPVVIERNSSSDTIIIMGKLRFSSSPKNLVDVLKNYPVVLKISFRSKYPEEDNSLDVEIAVYEKIVNPILVNHWSPHLVGFLGKFLCDTDTAVSKFSEDVGNKFHEQRTRIYQQNLHDDDDATLLLLERVNGLSLFETIVKYDPPIGDYFSIIFQVLWTLNILSYYGVRHNDIHINNVLVERISPTMFYYFTSEKDYFALPITYMAKVYDFDLAGISNRSEGIPKNTKIDFLGFGPGGQSYCTGHGICNEANPKFDEFKFLFSLASVIPKTQKNAPLLSFMFEIIKPELFSRAYGYAGTLCEIESPGVCKGDWMPSDEEVVPITDALERFFGKYKKTLPNFDRDLLPITDANFSVKPIFFWPNVNKNRLLSNLKKLK